MKPARPPLPPRHIAFIDALLSDPARVAAKAYHAAYGVTGPACYSGAAWLMRDPRILEEIAERDAATLERNKLSVDRLISHLLEIIEADPRELMSYHRGACRYCYGTGHKYQRTPAELERDLKKHFEENPMDELGLNFDFAGGDGYNPTRDPHPNCPECWGRGDGAECVADTRTLSGPAARLFAGLQRTKDGLRVLTRNQDKALETALRVTGLLSEKPTQGAPDTEPPPVNIEYVMQDGRASCQTQPE